LISKEHKERFLHTKTSNGATQKTTKKLETETPLGDVVVSSEIIHHDIGKWETKGGESVFKSTVQKHKGHNPLVISIRALQRDTQLDQD
jgi:hypothetical protein